MLRLAPFFVGGVTLWGMLTLLTNVEAQVPVPKELLPGKTLDSGVPNPFNFANPAGGFDFSKLFNFGGQKKKKDGDKKKSRKGDDDKDDKRKKKKKGSTSEEASEEPSASSEKSSSSEE